VDVEGLLHDGGALGPLAVGALDGGAHHCHVAGGTTLALGLVLGGLGGEIAGGQDLGENLGDLFFSLQSLELKLASVDPVKLVGVVGGELLLDGLPGGARDHDLPTGGHALNTGAAVDHRAKVVGPAGNGVVLSERLPGVDAHSDPETAVDELVVGALLDGTGGVGVDGLGPVNLEEPELDLT